MLNDVFVLIVALLALVFFSGVVVDTFEKIAFDIRVNKLLLATLLIGMSTSVPELFIGIVSALRGEPQIALGNVVGANIANMSLVAGSVALFAGVVPVIGSYANRDLWVTVLVTMFPFLLASDGLLSSFDGLILIFAYLYYVVDMLRQTQRLKHSKMLKQKKTFWKIGKTRSWLGHFSLLFGSLLIVIFVSNQLIESVMNLTSGLGVNLYWVGLLILALGTTLPELVLSLTASYKKDNSLILGSVLGSMVVNSTLVIGIVSVIKPIVYDSSLQKGVSGLFMVLILGLFWMFTKSKHKLEKWEGMVLVGVYIMFVGLQFLIS